MDIAEFDKFAEEYWATHKTNLAVTGESPDYFARYKVVETARRLRTLGLAPRRVLDFGCGIGNSAPHLRAAFPQAQITGADVSEKSLSVARQRFPGAAEARSLHGRDPVASRARSARDGPMQDSNLPNQIRSGRASPAMPASVRRGSSGDARGRRSPRQSPALAWTSRRRAAMHPAGV